MTPSPTWFMVEVDVFFLFFFDEIMWMGLSLFSMVNWLTARASHDCCRGRVDSQARVRTCLIFFKLFLGFKIASWASDTMGLAQGTRVSRR